MPVLRNPFSRPFMESTEMNASISRRTFVGAAAAAAACAITPTSVFGAPAILRTGRRSADFNGVKVGIIAPYSFRGTASSAEEILSALRQLGLSHVELQNGPIEQFAGAPAGQGGGPPRGAQLTDAQRSELEAARRAQAEALRQWRLTTSMAPFRTLRRMYEDAGTTIDIVKFGLGPAMTDEEVHYCFEVARALGATSVTCEPPVSETKRLGRLAEAHRIMLGYHNHANVTSVEAFGRPGSWEQTFFYSPFNGANVDIGHFVAGNSFCPEPFIREYHHRITNLHLKDRKVDQGENLPWGQGDTRVREILRVMRQEQYPFQATIELEYPVPEGSDVMTELAKCVDFCRAAVA
jgi:sugar phosphate isomerase/epimerase